MREKTLELPLNKNACFYNCNFGGHKGNDECNCSQQRHLKILNNLLHNLYTLPYSLLSRNIT